MSKSFKLFFLLSVLVTFMFCSSACSKSKSDNFEGKSKIEVIAEIPPGDILEMVVSEDGEHCAFSVDGPSGFLVVHDGNSFGPFDSILDKTVSLNAVGDRVAFGVIDDDKPFLFLDGKATDLLPPIAPVVFSSLGESYAYKTLSRGLKIVVINGETGQRFDDVTPIVFSENGKRCAYVGFLDGKANLVVNGDIVGEFLEGGQPVFSETGDVLAVVVRNAEGYGLWVNGTITGSYEYTVDEMSVVLSKTGQRHAWFAASEDNQYLVVDHDPILLDGDSVQDNLIFSPDEEKVAYGIGGPGGFGYFINTKSTSIHDATRGRLVFSPDSKRWAYGARDGKNSYVVIDGTNGPNFEKTNSAIFSPDSQHYAYKGYSGDERWMIFDGKKLPGFDGIGNVLAAFSPDSKHLVYRAMRQGEWGMVIDGEFVPVAVDGYVGGSKIIFSSSNMVHSIGVVGSTLVIARYKISS